MYNTDGTKYIITECKFSIAGIGVDYSEFSIAGNKLPDEIREKIKSVPVGTEIYIEYIKARMGTGKDSLVWKISPVKIVLTD